MIKNRIENKQKIEILKEKIKNIPEIKTEPEPIDVLRREEGHSLEKEEILRDISENEMGMNIVHQLEQANEELQSLLVKKKERDFLMKQISKIKIPQIVPVKNVDEDEIKISEEKIVSLETSLKEKRILYEEYLEYKKNLEKYEEFVEKSREIEDLNTKFECINHEICVIESIQNKIIFAETKALNDIVSLINSFIELYVGKFFRDSYLSAKILTYKDLKGSGEMKSEIQMAVEFNGELVGINSLSGGEFFRLEFADVPCIK